MRKVFSLNLVRFNRNGLTYGAQALVVSRARSWRYDVWAGAYDPYGTEELKYLGAIEPSNQDDQQEIEACVAELCIKKLFFDTKPRKKS